MSYIAPTWINGQPPAINAERLNSLCRTVANLDAAMPAKQDKLTFDNTPTAGSSNPVKSGGIKTALDGKAAASHTHAMSDVIGLTSTTQYGPAGVVGFQGSEDFPLADCVAEITPVQAGSGDPSPTNIRPISGWTGAKVYATGKNMLPLFDQAPKSNIFDFVDYDKTSGTVSVKCKSTSVANYTQTITPTFEEMGLIEGQTYVVTGVTNTSMIFLTVQSSPSGGSVAYIRSGSWSFTYDPNTHGEYCLGLRTATSDLDTTTVATSQPMIRLASDADATFEPYKGQTIEVTFPSTNGAVYGGRLDVLAGVLTMTHVLYQPTSIWKVESGVVTLNERLYRGWSSSCSHYTRGEWDDSRENRYWGSETSAIRIRDTVHATTKADYEAYLAAQQQNGTPVTFVFPLAIPITYQLTPQLVTAVAGANHIWADTGNVTVAYGAFPGALQRELPRAFKTYYITAGWNGDSVLGDNATAEGYQNAAVGECSHAEGYGTLADGWGYGAHAEGLNTRATGYFSHAEGINTFASGEEPGVSSIQDLGGAHAEGFGTTASGEQSHAEGKNTNAANIAAHAEGKGSSAGGEAAHAEGMYTDAVEQGSHAEGYRCQAFGTFSHAEGMYTKASGNAQHVFGKYNKSDTTSVEIVGWGTDTADSKRKNIRTLDNSGNMTIAGTLTQSSDAQLKTVEGEIPDVSEIHAVRFRWNDVNGQHDDVDHVGYIAQDVEKVAPFMVKKDSNGYKALDYIAFLCAKMELLERRVKELEEKKE